MRARCETRRREAPSATTRRARENDHPWGEARGGFLRVSFAIHSSTRSRRCLEAEKHPTLALALRFAMIPPAVGAQIAAGIPLKLGKQLHLAPSRLERDSAQVLEADPI